MFWIFLNRVPEGYCAAEGWASPPVFADNLVTSGILPDFSPDRNACLVEKKDILMAMIIWSICFEVFNICYQCNFSLQPFCHHLGQHKTLSWASLWGMKLSDSPACLLQPGVLALNVHSTRILLPRDEFGHFSPAEAVPCHAAFRCCTWNQLPQGRWWDFVVLQRWCQIPSDV